MKVRVVVTETASMLLVSRGSMRTRTGLTLTATGILITRIPLSK